MIAPAPVCTIELSIFIPTELPHFTANYVKNRDGASQYTNLSKLDFFKLRKTQIGSDIKESAINDVKEAIFGGSKTHSIKQPRSQDVY